MMRTAICLMLFIAVLAAQAENAIASEEIMRANPKQTIELLPSDRSIDLSPWLASVNSVQWARARKLDLSVRLAGIPDTDGITVRVRVKGARWYVFNQDCVGVRCDRPQHIGYELQNLHSRIGTGPVRDVSLELVGVPPDVALTFTIESIRLTGTDKHGYSNDAIVDRFGQYIPGHWPEKISEDHDLLRWEQWESRWLDDRSRTTDNDRFGGDTSLPSSNASGFFRVEQDTTKRWWLITPEGHRMLSYGVNAISLWTYTDVQDRQVLYEWIPESDGAYRDAIEGTRVRFYSANLIKKYDSDWVTQWSNRAVDRLKAWGMNTLGAWSDQSVTGLKQLPYVVCLQIKHTEAWRELPAVASDIPDPFNQDFELVLRKWLPEQVVSRRNDPWLIGYFLSNELHWQELTDVRLLDLPMDSPAGRYRQALLENRYGTADECAKAWGVSAENWQGVFGADPKALNDQARQDLKLFRGEIADRFFKIYTDVMRELDSNHLILGVRFLHGENHEAAPEIYTACAKYCDVISENPYVDKPDAEYFRRRYALTHKPFLISEFHFGLNQSDRQLGWGARWVDTRASRVEAVRRYVEDAARMPQVVGFHWFAYVDAPLLGRHDGENGQYGLVDVADVPYFELAELNNVLGQRLNQLHRDPPHR